MKTLTTDLKRNTTNTRTQYDREYEQALQLITQEWEQTRKNKRTSYARRLPTDSLPKGHAPRFTYAH